MRVRTKICGITRLEDALHAASCGVDALGFVFYDKSPRYIAPDAAARIIAQLPPFVSAVGLFVNETPELIRSTADLCALDLIQLHGDETPEHCHLPPYRVVKALRVKDASSLAQAESYPVNALLLDAWSPAAYGGTGERFNWELAREMAAKKPVILAGGLCPENVAEAVSAVAPYALDVSSGVESSPGIKDPQRVQAFIENARRAMESHHV